MCRDMIFLIGCRTKVNIFPFLQVICRGRFHGAWWSSLRNIFGKDTHPIHRSDDVWCNLLNLYPLKNGIWGGGVVLKFHFKIDAKPTGFVCQLHYRGGGSLLCQTSTGDSRQLPFAHAPPHVRVGHTVTFSLAADGVDLAVDLEVCQEKAATSSAEAEMGGQIMQEKPAKPVFDISKQPARKLQRSITRFHNADLKERLRMIETAEGLLHDLLNEVELDGDAICKLLCRCAGWLHPPGSFEAKHVSSTEDTAGAAVSEPSDLQRRVRRLLILALSSLDLSDTTTYRAVETAVLHILELLQGKETSFSGNGKSLAMRQWRQLRELLVAEAPQSDPTQRKASDEALEGLRKKATTRLPRKDMSAAVDGVFRPNKRVRSLPAVYEAPEQVVLLKCSNCVERISTTWFWTHSGHGKTYALVPCNGHAACRKTLGKTCPWRSLDGTDTCADIFKQLDLCHHNSQRPLCVECGGSSICPHNRRRYRCSACKMPSLTEHAMRNRVPPSRDCARWGHREFLNGCRVKLGPTLSLGWWLVTTYSIIWDNNPSIGHGTHNITSKSFRGNHPLWIIYWESI